MDFLRCTPCVFVVKDKYEIVVFTASNGLCQIEVNGKIYHEKNAGILPTENTYHKIDVPQKELDKAKKYKVIYRHSPDKKAYFTVLDKEQTAEFFFRPVEKETDIKIYHIADVHCSFDISKDACSYFGKETDLYIVNGDIGEVEAEEDYFEAIKFIADISQGEVPVVCARGNHDARGKLAERFSDFFPSDGIKTYYTFKVGCISGVVFDAGEDKYDDHVYGAEYNYLRAYDGFNIFHDYRLRETEFLKRIKSLNGKYKIAVGHICPAYSTSVPAWAIEDGIYGKWNELFNAMNLDFMIGGHLHKGAVLQRNDQRSRFKNAYPIIIGTECKVDNEPDPNVFGTALELNEKEITYRFTGKNHEILSEGKLPRANKK